MIIRILIFLLCVSPVFAVDFLSLSSDRAAIERVYHAHRTGTTGTFGQAVPAARLEELVRSDLKKEQVLTGFYHVTITPPMIEAETQRINATTRAPETLAEIKAALGNDAARFAESFVKPIVVERTLRDRFENDDTLHAPQRELAETVRLEAIASKNLEGQKELMEITWQLTPPPTEKNIPSAPSSPVEAKTKSPAYGNQATARIAEDLNAPAEAGEELHYLADLPSDLQAVLISQLIKAGDISAVIESAGAFQLYLAKNRTATTLSASVLTIPKQSYAAWLASQP
jgi:hypothetical protein